MLSPRGRTMTFRDSESLGNFPFNWSLEQIRNALQAQVGLQQSALYFGNPIANAEFFARRIESLRPSMLRPCLPRAKMSCNLRPAGLKPLPRWR